MSSPPDSSNRTARIVFWGGAALLVASLVFAAFVIRNRLAASAMPPAQTVAADFSLPSLDGDTIHLADMQGKVVVLNFWASWCFPCAAEMPEIQSFYEAHKDEGIVVVGINVGETEDTARAFVDRMGVTFPIALDESTDVATSYGMRGLPMTFVIDKDGAVHWFRLGTLDQKMLEGHLP